MQRRENLHIKKQIETMQSSYDLRFYNLLQDDNWYLWVCSCTPYFCVPCSQLESQHGGVSPGGVTQPVGWILNSCWSLDIFYGPVFSISHPTLAVFECAVNLCIKITIKITFDSFKLTAKLLSLVFCLLNLVKGERFIWSEEKPEYCLSNLVKHIGFIGYIW